MKDGQSADAHIEFIDAILDVYGKTLTMVEFVVADNCATNKSVATKLDVPLIGCASHRFNLAMVRFLSNHEHLICMIQRLMTSFRQPNNAARVLRKFVLNSDPAEIIPLSFLTNDTTARW